MKMRDVMTENENIYMLSVHGLLQSFTYISYYSTDDLRFNIIQLSPGREMSLGFDNEAAQIRSFVV